MAEPVVSMTTLKYWTGWVIVGGIVLIIARIFLIQPIVEACRPPLPKPLSILWHPVAPITDWTPHTSTVLR
jgi:hypothetical protein